MNLHGALEFLQEYPEMSFGPMKGTELLIKGTFKFTANSERNIKIADSYELRILVPEKFPYELPKVTELNNKIPRDFKHHVNPDDTLCVGSPLRIIMKLYKSPSLIRYAEECLIPYLYAVSHKLKYGGEFIFGELDHGEQGIIQDYTDILGLANPQQVTKALILLSIKKKAANKLPCPCECGKRLGSCRFHRKMNEMRKVAPRSFFINHVNNLGS